MHRRLPVVVMVVALCGCGSNSLSNLASGELSLGIQRFTEVNTVSVVLQPAGDVCPTLLATATINGAHITQEEGGGSKPGSFYFIPTSTCTAARYVYQGATATQRIATGGPLTLTIQDNTATFELRSDDALVVVPQAVPATTRRGGEQIRFTLSRPVLSLETAQLSFRKQGVSDASYASAMLDGMSVTAPIPNDGPGTYTWFLSVSALVAPTSCTGIAKCNIWLETTAEGDFTVSP